MAGRAPWGEGGICMSIRYKTTTLNGKPILSHRKVWIQEYGKIPDGFHVHHKNDDRFDNKLENLELISASDHCRLHSLGRPAWNKGIKYGETDGYKKSMAVRKENRARVCAETFALWQQSGLTQTSVAEQLGISRRQVCDRLRSHRRNVDL